MPHAHSSENGGCGVAHLCNPCLQLIYPPTCADSHFLPFSCPPHLSHRLTNCACQQNSMCFPTVHESVNASDASLGNLSWKLLTFHFYLLPSGEDPGFCWRPWLPSLHYQTSLSSLLLWDLWSSAMSVYLRPLAYAQISLTVCLLVNLLATEPKHLNYLTGVGVESELNARTCVQRQK